MRRQSIELYLFIIDDKRHGDLGVVGPAWVDALFAIADKVAVKAVVGVSRVNLRHGGGSSKNCKIVTKSSNVVKEK